MSTISRARGARTLACIALAGTGWLSAPAFAAGEVTLYTTREPGLIQPLLTAFSSQTGVKVNTVFVKDGLLERVKAEGLSLIHI